VGLGQIEQRTDIPFAPAETAKVRGGTLAIAVDA
jgi:hypothetical protein